MSRLTFGLMFGILSCAACGTRVPSTADLAITRARVLDVRSGKVLAERTVTIKEGVIIAITAPNASRPRALREIDAHGRLLTPGLIDTHFHLCVMFCRPGSDTMPLSMSRDSIAAYRREFAAQYLPHGVTSVRDAGTSEEVMPLLQAWMARSPGAPNFYPVGAHLISPQRNDFRAPWQVVVRDPAAAAAKVREYHAFGIRHIKLYWRLREPEFKSALREAQRLGMNVAGHVDQKVMTIDRALDLGLRNVEHIHTFGYSIATNADFDSLVAQVPRTLGVHPPSFPPTALYMNVPEIFNFFGADNLRLIGLVDQFKATRASLTPTLHVFAQRYGLTYFTSAPRDSTENTSVWTEQQRRRTIAGYRVMTSYVKRLHDAGVRLNTGTDAAEPGKALLSEMLLLHDAGIPMVDVFRTATLNSAESLGVGADSGSIEVGKRADLILFDGDPLVRPQELLGTKTVLKDGTVVPSHDTRRLAYAQ